MFNINDFIVDFNRGILAGEKLINCYTETSTSIARHLDPKGGSLSELIKLYRPNIGEPALQERYRCMKPITNGYFLRSITKQSKIFNTSKITVNKGSVSEVVEKMEADGKFIIKSETTSSRHNFETFFKDAYLSKGAKEANAFVAYEPMGEGLFSDAEKIDVNLRIVNVRDIKSVGVDYVCYKVGEAVYRGDEGQKIRYDDVYHVLTDKFFYVLYKETKDGKAKTRIMKDLGREIKYPHNLKEVPKSDFGGYSVEDEEGNRYWISFFAPAVPIADEMIQHKSDLDTLEKLSGHPITVIDEAECEAEGCNGGKIFDGEDQVSCSVCSGTGIKANIFTPEKYYYKTSSSVTGEGSSDMPVSYVSPPLGSLNYHNEKFLMNGQRLEQQLFITDQSEAQSGEAKKYAREEYEAFLILMCDNIARLYDDALRFIGGIVLVNEESLNYSIVKPKKFDIVSEDEMVANFGEAKVNLCRSDVFSTYIDLITKKYENNPVQLKICTFLALYDPLSLETSPDESFEMGLYDKADFEFFKQAPLVLQRMQLMGESEKILNLDFEQLYKLVIDRVDFKKTKPEMELA